MSSKRSPIKSAALFAITLFALSLFLPSRVAHAYPGVPDDVNGSNWMSKLPDNIPLSDLSIPGSHDSGTMWSVMEWSKHSKCQDTTIGAYSYINDDDEEVHLDGLLARGVRHLDVRLEIPAGTWSDELVLCHGNYWNLCTLESEDGTIALTLNQTIKWVEEFLRDNPTETVIIEFTSETDDDDKPAIYDYFKNLAHKQDPLVWKGDHTPTLGEARGKMILFSNGVYPQENYAEEGGGYWAFTVGWASGDTSTKSAVRARDFIDGEIWSQNMWDGVSPDEKWEYVYNSLGRNPTGSSLAEAVLADNAQHGKRTWFVSYSSANNGFLDDGPDDFARVVNPRISSQIAYVGSDVFCGLLAMDYVTANLARAVWATNYNRWAWGPTTYEWSEDYSTCTAKRVKTGDASKVETVKVQTTFADTRPATCTQPGTGTYTASFPGTSWASDQTKDVETPALGHQWRSESVPGIDSCAHVWCENNGCDYGKDKGLYMQLSATNAQYDGGAHEAKVSCRMPEDVQKLLKEPEYYGEDNAKLDGPPVYAGTYKAVLALIVSQPVSIECTYTISKRPVNVVALDQIVSTTAPGIHTSPDYAMLQPVDDAQLVEGDVLKSVNLNQNSSSDTSGEIIPWGAHIYRGDDDVSDSYNINYVKGTWLKVDQGKPIFEPPTAKLGMIYDSTEMALVNPGRIDGQYGYVMQYALSDGNTAPTDGWGTAVPEAKNAGIYSLWYRLVNENDENDKIGPLRTFATISPRYVDLSWNPGSDEFVYDGKPHVPEAEATNVVEGEEVTVDVTAHQTFAIQSGNLAVDDKGPSKVGYYAAEATGLSGANANNYRIKKQDALYNFHIAPRPVNIEGAVAENKVYDGTCDVKLNLSNVSFSELVEGDILELKDCTAAFTDPNAGDNKAVLVENVILGGKDASEYVLGNDSLTLTATITQSPVQLYWGTSKFWYDGLSHVPATYVGGLLGADWCMAIVSGEAVEVGTHTATVVGLTNSNYCLPLSSDVSHDFEIRLSDVDAPYQVVLEDGSPALTSANLGTVANELTTIEERGCYMYGTPLMVTLTSKGIDKSAVPEADASSAQKLLDSQEFTAGQWFNLSLTKLFEKNTTAITSTKTPVQIEVTVPTKLQAAGRTYALVRCLDGKAEKIAEGTDATFKAKTDTFSSYLIAYRDAPKPAPKPAKATKPTTVAHPAAGTIDARWKAVKGAKSYELSWRVAGGTWWTVSTSKTKLTIDGPKAGKLYDVRVRAVNDTGKGAWSTPARRWMKGASKVKAATGKAKGSIKVTWKKDKSATGGYKIFVYAKKGGKVVKTKTVSKAIASATIKGLKSRKRYYIRVRPYRKRGGVTYSGALSGYRSVRAK